jgi:hypothetical protein
MQYSKADLTDPDEQDAFYATGSDRAIAILLGAIVENRLTDVIRAKTIPDGDAKLLKNLLRPSGALGSFGTKNQIAYLFGFIPSLLFGEIETVVKIRNAFAHKLDIKDFSSPQILTLMNNLRAYRTVRTVTAANPPGTQHVSGIEFGASTLGDYRLCVSYYISQLRNIEKYSGRPEAAGDPELQGTDIAFFDA